MKRAAGANELGEQARELPFLRAVGHQMRSTLCHDQLLCESSVTVNEARRRWNGATKWRW
jgi:hypothetical protein